MKLDRFLRILPLAAALTGTLLFAGACSEDEPEEPIGGFARIEGVVTNDSGDALPGVDITVTGTELKATSAADGSYAIDQVPVATCIMTFKIKGYLTGSVTVTAKRMLEEKPVKVDAILEFADAKIQGTILDARNNNAPLEGVTVTVEGLTTDPAVTDGQGKYEIADLALGSYTLTFTKPNYTTVVRNLTRDSFIEGVATIDLTMGGTKLLGELTADDLKNAEKWYYNEYRGGRNAENYPHWDWACDYMCALDFRGAWEEQNEGTTIQIRNSGDEQKNPADTDTFDSYVFGSKTITEDNRILTVQMRTHDANNATIWGVQVIDLSAAEPKAEKIGGDKEHATGDYQSVDFDLSNYIGKEVIVAIGTYRAATGDYWRQLVLRRIAFADRKIEGWNWLPGDEVPGLEGWQLTQQIVRSTMPHTKKSFTGISPTNGNRDNYVEAYRAWRPVSHMAAEWSFVPLHKDPEVFPSEGYLIKTRGGGTPVNTREPEAYFYAKFSVEAGCNRLTLKARNFGSNYTFFKLTAVDEDCNVIHLQPTSNTARQAEAAADGCWKFKHDAGGKDKPEDYAAFEYDLSQFNGKDVMLVFGVYKGEDNGDENKLCFYNVQLN